MSDTTRFPSLKPVYGLDRYLLLVMALAAPVWAPLFFPGLFESHSGLLAVYDVVDLNQSLLQGLFTLGWSPALNQGGPLPFYLTEAPVLLGINPVTAVKLVLGLSILGAGLGMYMLGRQLWGRRPALLAAVVYIYAPFFLAALYVRGSLVDAVAYALIPVILWQAHRAVFDSSRLLFSIEHGVWLAVALAALTWTQWGLALAVGVFVLAYLLFAGWETWRSDARRVWPALLVATGALLVGELAGLLLWLPIRAEGMASLWSPANGTDHAVYLFQLLLPTWGTGISIAGPNDTVPLQIGVIPLALAALGLVVLVTESETRPRAYIIFGLVMAAVVSLFVLPVAAPLWGALDRLVFYPWQLLGLIVLSLAIVTGAVAAAWHRPLAHLGPWAALITATMLASYGYLGLSFIDDNRIPAQHPVNAVLGGDIVLLDYTLAAETLQDAPVWPSIRAGDTIHLTLYWQVVRPVTEDYTVFTHAIDAQPRQWAGRDNPPVQGTRPTSSWRVGELIADEYELVLDSQTPAGLVELEAGMYEPVNGQRLMVHTRSGADLRAVLGHLRVR
ncbi:MAG: hypothetical protein KKA73_04260 [Chloroflexi bacterium]|nr:hypothetical protein [Chloroflexota bacterium]MBU1746880.1 hypothetical protein [Chloroflexota bacterium]